MLLVHIFVRFLISFVEVVQRSLKLSPKMWRHSLLFYHLYPLAARGIASQ
jgi:hypothetical protein